MDVDAGRQAVRDLLPGLAQVARAIDVRLEVAELMAIDASRTPSFASKCDASIVVTRLHGVSAGGVTFCHVLPSFGRDLNQPSSVPIQISGAFSGDGATV